jgi:GTP-binding protein
MISGKNIFPDGNRLFAEYLGKFNDVKILPETTAEIAFIGRSNSGKSSLLKSLLNSPKMPQVSSKPGSTRLIHLYQMAGGATLADFPGYGYAKSSHAFRARFTAMLVHYLNSNRAIKALCLMMDSRRRPEEEEEQISRIAQERRVPLILCLNKADQLNQSETAKLIASYKNEKQFFEIVLLSAQKRQNLDYLRNYIASLA